MILSELQKINRERCERWHSGMFPWVGSDWSGAMCGEAGEAANVVKKIRRIETALVPIPAAPLEVRSLIRDLGAEIADTILYALLLADHYQIDVEEAVSSKFNLVSEKQGFPERIYP